LQVANLLPQGLAVGQKARRQFWVGEHFRVALGKP